MPSFKSALKRVLYIVLFLEGLSFGSGWSESHQMLERETIPPKFLPEKGLLQWTCAAMLFDDEPVINGLPITSKSLFTFPYVDG
jgi:hypothetical protein